MDCLSPPQVQKNPGTPPAPVAGWKSQAGSQKAPQFPRAPAPQRTWLRAARRGLVENVAGRGRWANQKVVRCSIPLPQGPGRMPLRRAVRSKWARSSQTDQTQSLISWSDFRAERELPPRVRSPVKPRSRNWRSGSAGSDWWALWAWAEPRWAMKASQKDLWHPGGPGALCALPRESLARRQAARPRAALPSALAPRWADRGRVH